MFSTLLEPLTIGTMGTQKPFRFKFEQYVQEARTKMPTRKAAGKLDCKRLVHRRKLVRTSFCRIKGLTIIDYGSLTNALIPSFKDDSS